MRSNPMGDLATHEISKLSIPPRPPLAKGGWGDLEPFGSWHFGIHLGFVI